MAYQKLFTVVMDSPVGYATVNQAALNSDELHTQMAVEHGTIDPQYASVAVDYHRLGRHDIKEIPRTAFTSKLVIQPNQLYTASTSLGGPGVSGIWRPAVGLYGIGIVGLSTFYGVATIMTGLSTLTFLPPIVRPFYAVDNAGSQGIWVSTFVLDAGDFVPGDAAFSLLIYGDP